MPHISYQTSYTFISSRCLHTLDKRDLSKVAPFSLVLVFWIMPVRSERTLGSSDVPFFTVAQERLLLFKLNIFISAVDLFNVSASTLNGLIFIMLMGKAIKEQLIEEY